MDIIADTELILTSEKKIYHLNLSKEEIADDIILVGDPERVKRVSDKFDSIQYNISNREFVTHTGTLNNKKISVISTGIGTDNIDIVVNELDALVNIDFNTRTINPIKKSLNIIRLGTSGALQKDIEVDTLLVSSYALGFDNIAHFYSANNIIEQEMSKAYYQHAKWPKEASLPYIVKASERLLSLFYDLPSGITATASGFYGPQGRKIRLEPGIKKLNKTLTSFKFNNRKIANFEMETSALYYLAKALSHNALTICAVIGNRTNKKYSKNYQKPVEEMIKLVLERICK